MKDDPASSDGGRKSPGQKIERERERIERRQPRGKQWKGYRPGDKMPLSER